MILLLGCISSKGPGGPEPEVMGPFLFFYSWGFLRQNISMEKSIMARGRVGITNIEQYFSIVTRLQKLAIVEITWAEDIISFVQIIWDILRLICDQNHMVVLCLLVFDILFNIIRLFSGSFQLGSHSIKPRALNSRGFSKYMLTLILNWPKNKSFNWIQNYI